MATVSQAFQACRTLIEGGGIVDSASAAVPLRWPNEPKDSAGSVALPDDPSPFIYCEFVAEPGRLAGFGGGRGANLYRNPARFEAYVFTPKDEGVSETLSIAEQVAALFRSYRNGTISCLEATVHPGGDGSLITPPGLQSPVGNYFWACTEVFLIYDQIG